MSRFLLAFCISLLLSACQNQTHESSQARPNVLFIAVDDLRPELNCYGKSYIHSPNLDRLAQEGFLFERAYCNVPVCGASRASLLTGIRPRADRFIDYNAYAQEDAPGIPSLPQHFRKNGYYTMSLGKIFHHRNDIAASWSEPAWAASMEDTTATSWRNYVLEDNRIIDSQDDTRGPAYENAPVPDSAYFDGKTARKAVQQLRQFAKGDQPFFLALGFLKPHLPFNAPKKYWDLYQEEDIQWPVIDSMPEHAPLIAKHNSGELRAYYNIPPKGPVPDTLARKMIHGYYASVSYTDALIGQVLAELKRLELDQNTIVIVWGDHGWSLRDHGLWCKHSPFNVALQTPLLLKVPGMTAGQKIPALTEFVDIYPSLTELAGLGLPDHLQGESFVPILKDPSLPGKEAIFCRWKKADAIKTDRYLYTEWFSENDSSLAYMLYDHVEDPHETVNIADLPQHQALVQSFHTQLMEIRQIP